LRDDEHQRSEFYGNYAVSSLTYTPAIIQVLQDLHDMLEDYKPPKVIHPTIESLHPAKKSFFGALFDGASSNKATFTIPKNIPKGVYMYGDVGSGKTMMMDLFFDTLPNNIKNKTRIHFNNFMQQVHKDLHKTKIQYGTDFDAIPFVAAQIAERSTVLCFDEFQCTDVADAMILRR
jgi:protein AFG1